MNLIESDSTHRKGLFWILINLNFVQISIKSLNIFWNFKNILKILYRTCVSHPVGRKVLAVVDKWWLFSTVKPTLPVWYVTFVLYCPETLIFFIKNASEISEISDTKLYEISEFNSLNSLYNSLILLYNSLKISKISEISELNSLISLILYCLFR